MMAQAYGFQRVPTMTANPPVSIPAHPAANIAVVPKPREKYKLVLFKLGIAEIVIGSLCCLLAILAIAVTPSCYRDPSDVAQGIWCGAFILTSGVLGVKARSHPSVCMYNANMALSIIASVFMGILVIMSGIAAAIGCYSSPPIHCIIAMLGAAGMVITIIHSAYCCAGVCCRGYDKYQGSVVYTPQNQYIQQPQQMVQLANGQYMLVQAQPMMAAAPQCPMTSIPVTGSAITYQPAPNQPQQVSLPSTSTGAQATNYTKEQESQMQGMMESPPGYSLLPSHPE